ncbi:hypothetical protein Theos_0055 [Thermus oshimai JL-2]|uniref:Uncharacterized protein n=1 Tax=Thermus oshimai JL-2 TaxID=751945 RepID=K7QXJ1_THEOS|nr:hypothetical protein [Thermus oshimai]AFV75140.1 hypothetical protein Theos_0055 [Thermus oshimai JL-2]
MPEVHQVILEAVQPHLGQRAQVVLEEGLKRLGKTPKELTPEDGEALLKGPFFRELQARLRPEEARRVVEEALKRLKTPEGLKALEEGLRRFQLYLDWPEVGRLRALYNRLRQGEDPALLAEGLRLLEALEEKLEEALLRQARDLAHLEETLERVRHLGGAKVRRLESLVGTIRQAHGEGTLAQGEVERARALALELRKLLESSAVRAPTLPEIVFQTEEAEPEVYVTVEDASELEGELVIDLEALPEEAAERIQAMVVEEERRKLKDLLARHAPLLERATVSPLLAEVEALLEAGSPAGEKLQALEAAFKEAEANLKAEKRARLIQLEEALRRLPLPPEAKAPLEAALRLAEETLKEGGFPDLLPLEESLKALEEEARRLREEKEALLRELAAKGEAFRPLLEELKATPEERLGEALPALRARYAELLKKAGEEAALKEKLQEAEAALKALEGEARALGLGEAWAGLLGEVAQGRLPDLEGFRKRLAEAKAERRQRALEELARLEALAERFRAFGGEAVLRAIAEEKAKPLPDPTPIARALQALRRKLEARRSELTTRLAAFLRGYARVQDLKSETTGRLKPLAEFLEAAWDRLARLGPAGVLEVERALEEAERLLKEAEREKEAAQAVLKEIGSADLEALFGALAGEDPLKPLRLPGVEALGLLEEGPLPLPRPPLEAFQKALDLLDAGLKEKRKAAVVLLGPKALVLAPREGKTLAALLERSALSAFLQELGLLL